MSDNNDTEQTNAVVIERTYEYPIALVWSMWTESEHFASWYGPTGARIPVAEMDVQVGGRRHICMEMDTPNGTMQMWFAGEYLEIDPVTRLVYTEAMSDADGNVKSPAEMGMPEGSPTSTVVVVQLSDRGTSTDVVLEHRGIPADSPGAQGWMMAMDALGDHLAGLSG